MGGVLKCIADDDDHSGGFELSCEIIIHHIFLYLNIKCRYCENYTILSFTQSYERVKTFLEMPQTIVTTSHP